MESPVGISLIVAGTSSALFVAFVLRTRLPAAIGLTLMALTSAAVAAGGLLVQKATPTPLDWALGLSFLGGFGLIHSRVVLGPFGKNVATGEGSVPAPAPPVQ